MQPDTLGIWTAIAATVAVVISFSIFLIQRRNLLESARPELVLTDWSRRSEGEGDAAHDRISFQTIKNVGRGAALHIHLNAFHMNENRPTAVLSTVRLPILPADDASEVDGEIVVWWKNVDPDDQRSKHLPMTVVILCWDSRGMRHETRYSLFATESPKEMGMPSPLAPGVMLTSRTTTTTAVWLLKLFSRAGRLPVVGRWFQKKLNPSLQDSAKERFD